MAMLLQCYGHGIAMILLSIGAILDKSVSSVGARLFLACTGFFAAMMHILVVSSQSYALSALLWPLKKSRPRKLVCQSRYSPLPQKPKRAAVHRIGGRAPLLIVGSKVQSPGSHRARRRAVGAGAQLTKCSQCAKRLRIMQVLAQPPQVVVVHNSGCSCPQLRESGRPRVLPRPGRPRV